MFTELSTSWPRPTLGARQRLWAGNIKGSTAKYIIMVTFTPVSPVVRYSTSSHTPGRIHGCIICTILEMRHAFCTKNYIRLIHIWPEIWLNTNTSDLKFDNATSDLKSAWMHPLLTWNLNEYTSWNLIMQPHLSWKLWIESHLSWDLTMRPHLTWNLTEYNHIWPEIWVNTTTSVLKSDNATTSDWIQPHLIWMLTEYNHIFPEFCLNTATSDLTCWLNTTWNITKYNHIYWIWLNKTTSDLKSDWIQPQLTWIQSKRPF